MCIYTYIMCIYTYIMCKYMYVMCINIYIYVYNVYIVCVRTCVCVCVCVHTCVFLRVHACTWCYSHDPHYSHYSRHDWYYYWYYWQRPREALPLFLWWWQSAGPGRNSSESALQSFDMVKTVAHCNTLLQHTATHYSTLQHLQLTATNILKSQLYSDLIW